MKGFSRPLCESGLQECFDVTVTGSVFLCQKPSAVFVEAAVLQRLKPNMIKALMGHQLSKKGPSSVRSVPNLQTLVNKLCEC